MNKYQELERNLTQNPKTWLITGVAGFIGSNILEKLLKLNQRVVGLDNFSTGYQRNLSQAKNALSVAQWANFQLVNGDLRNIRDCEHAMTWRGAENKSIQNSSNSNVDYVLHHAAVGSVAHSIEDPLNSNDNNVTGFLNILISAKKMRIKNLIYASSSAAYGDDSAPEKIEEALGRPLSPYAVTKTVNELYAQVFSRIYGIRAIGLRYFNVFGERQDPNGSYAAVIPRWVHEMLINKQVYIYGDGKTTRDFCYVGDIVQANILAATTKNKHAYNQVFNIASGKSISLDQLFSTLKSVLEINSIDYNKRPTYENFRLGDIKHSQANIDKAKNYLGYFPMHSLKDGLLSSVNNFLEMKKEFD
tara:strand:- start:163 stop:1242 length:1080 start_codon:yes stop_codon:yes gene_type:complete